MPGSFLFVLYCFLFGAHPLHVSVTEIQYNETDKALEIMMRVFMDDLELTMKKHYSDPNLDILNPTKKSLDEMMAEYLNEHFVVGLDNKKQKPVYLGHEREGEAFVFFIEISKVRRWNNIAVMNNILMELYDDQSNLVHVTVAGKVKSLRLTKRNPSGQLSF